MVMGVIGWIVLGLIAGYIASMLVNRRGEGRVFDILLGMVGAVIGNQLRMRARSALGLLQIKPMIIMGIAAVKENIPC